MRGNVGPWRSTGMACFMCHKIGHLTKDCKMNNLSSNRLEDNEGEKVVDMETVRTKMNKMWKQ